MTRIGVTIEKLPREKIQENQIVSECSINDFPARVDIFCTPLFIDGFGQVWRVLGTPFGPSEPHNKFLDTIFLRFLEHYGGAVIFKSGLCDLAVFVALELDGQHRFDSSTQKPLRLVKENMG